MRHPTHSHSSWDRSFAVAGPRLWNSLPAELRDLIRWPMMAVVFSPEIVYPSNLPLHLATAGASDSALMLTLCALNARIIIIISLRQFRRALKTHL